MRYVDWLAKKGLLYVWLSSSQPHTQHMHSDSVLFLFQYTNTFSIILGSLFVEDIITGGGLECGTSELQGFDTG